MYSAQFTPFAARTQQFVKEQLGTADEKTQLPDDYLELENRVDALKQVHQKLLSVTYVTFFFKFETLPETKNTLKYLLLQQLPIFERGL